MVRLVLARDASFSVAEPLQPQVLIMDISRPQLNSIEADRQILRANARTQVIALSMHSCEIYLIRALVVGVQRREGHSSLRR